MLCNVAQLCRDQVVGFIDSIADPGQQWGRFMKCRLTNAEYSMSLPFVIKICILCFILCGCYLQPEMVLSIVSVFKSSKTFDGYASLLCNINDASDLQCLIDVKTTMPAKQNCETSFGSDQYDFCGTSQCHHMLHADTINHVIRLRHIH